MNATLTAPAPEQHAAWIERQLAHFTGTAGYYKVNHLPMVVTDGAKTMADMCAAYWLLDVIGSHQIDQASRARIPDLTWQAWRLTVDQVTRAATVSVGDGNGTWIPMQAVAHTDFPLAGVTLWALPHANKRDTVVLLPSEY